jgi:hypothetical protein
MPGSITIPKELLEALNPKLYVQRTWFVNGSYRCNLSMPRNLMGPIELRWYPEMPASVTEAEMKLYRDGITLALKSIGDELGVVFNVTG